MKLLDGYDNAVLCSDMSVRRALLRTDFVEAFDVPVTISLFYSEGGDEIDVYDGRRMYDPQTIYEVDEIDEAVAEFLRPLQE